MLRKILFLALCLFTLNILTTNADAEDFNRRYFSVNISSGYGNDAVLNAFGSFATLFCIDTTASCDDNYPLHNVTAGANLEISLPMGKKWAFRADAGYQYVLWHSDEGATNLKAFYKHNFTADMMFDRYFKASGKVRPYWSIGLADRHTVEVQPALAFGTHYMLNDHTSLKFQLTGGTLILWSFVEPQFGVAWHF